jgi:polyisoprenoid-binding protein YceI
MLAAASLGTLLLVSQTGAAVETYKIDPGHSQVGFSIRHFFSKIPGKFNTYEGTIALDPQDLSKSVVEVSIDTASIDTGNKDRDSHLQSPDFFDAQKFPKMTFKSTSIVPQGTNKATMKGDLTMHGVTKPVTLDVEILGMGTGMGGRKTAGFEAKGKLNRQDFGVAWNKALEGGGAVLGDEVEIAINIEGAGEKPAAAPAPPAPPKK